MPHNATIDHCIIDNALQWKKVEGLQHIIKVFSKERTIPSEMEVALPEAISGWDRSILYLQENVIEYENFYLVV